MNVCESVCIGEKQLGFAGLYFLSNFLRAWNAEFISSSGRM
jgi:hypothetical protein